MITIVIPVFNASLYLKQTLASVFAATHSKFELVLLDDHSSKETIDFLQGIESPVPTRIFYSKLHQWINYQWNRGAKVAKGEYVAFLNSDIILSGWWDVSLINGLKTHTVSCPHQIINGKRIKLLPVVEKIDPLMIQGACFMVKREDLSKLFPIPTRLKHWCGDNVIADRANKMKGVVFTEATMRHFITRSGRTIPHDLFLKRVLKDLTVYEKLSGKDLSFIRKSISPDTLFSSA